MTQVAIRWIALFALYSNDPLGIYNHCRYAFLTSFGRAQGNPRSYVFEGVLLAQLASSYCISELRSWWLSLTLVEVYYNVCIPVTWKDKNYILEVHLKVSLLPKVTPNPIYSEIC
jgi:hypothetical protein